MNLTLRKLSRRKLDLSCIGELRVFGIQRLGSSSVFGVKVVRSGSIRLNLGLGLFRSKGWGRGSSSLSQVCCGNFTRSGKGIFYYQGEGSLNLNMVDTITLTSSEQELRSLLLKVVEYIGSQGVVKPVVRFAGGWVRDKLLGLESDDIDIALDTMTGLEFYTYLRQYEQVSGKRVTSHGTTIAANPEKSKHLETISARVLGFEVDFVNLRSETYGGDSRVPKMEFGSPLDDALRRDITINSLFYNIHTGLVEDFCQQGLEDLAAKVIRTPRPALQTFRDDPLRILRCIRFSARLGFAIQPEVIEAMQDREIKVAFQTKISRERVGMELTKILKAPNPLNAFEAIHHCSLFSLIFMPHPPFPEDSCIEPLATGIEKARLMNWLLKSIHSGHPLPGYHFPSVPLQHLVGYGFKQTIKDTGVLLFSSYLSPLRNVVYPKKFKFEHSLVYMAKITIKVNAMIGQTMETYFSLTNQLTQLLKTNPSDWTRSSVGLFVHSAGNNFAETILTWTVQELHSGFDLDSSMHQLERFLEFITHHHLQDVSNLTPIIEGSRILTLLHLKPSKLVSYLKHQVLIWQLDHPNGTIQDCESFLKTNFGDPKIQSSLLKDTKF